MALKKFNPITPGTRQLGIVDRSLVSFDKNEFAVFYHFDSVQAGIHTLSFTNGTPILNKARITEYSSGLITDISRTFQWRKSKVLDKVVIEGDHLNMSDSSCSGMLGAIQILKANPPSLEIEEDEVVEVPEVAEEEEEVVEQEIFTVVEDMPKFKGCESLSGDAATACTMQKIQAYTAKVDYPQIAIDNDIEGKVYISFVVDRDGSVKEVTLLRGVDKLLDNAAMKHIKGLPKFASPGKQRGKAVKVKYNIPIVFKLG